MPNYGMGPSYKGGMRQSYSRGYSGVAGSTPGKRRYKDPFGSGKGSKKIDPIYEKFANAKRDMFEQSLGDLQDIQSGKASISTSERMRSAGENNARAIHGMTGSRGGSLAAATASQRIKNNMAAQIAQHKQRELEERTTRGMSFGPSGEPQMGRFYTKQQKKRFGL